MKTRKVFNEPGHAHSLTFSCYRRYHLLKSDENANTLFEAILRAKARFSFHLWAFVIMPNHVHLLVHPQTRVYDIGQIMKAIKGQSAKRILARMREDNYPELSSLKTIRISGNNEYRFWQRGGGYDRNIFSPKAILSEIEYIHSNPVRAELVETPLDWKWSSANAYHEPMRNLTEVDVCDLLCID